MGLLPAHCRSCGNEFLWFTGDVRQICGTCHAHLEQLNKEQDAEIARRRKAAVAARFAQARRERIDNIVRWLRVREIISYDPCGAYILRYDFTYRDPASGRVRQYGTESFWAYKPKGDELKAAREFNKRMIAKEIDKQCGLEATPMSMNLFTNLEVQAGMV